MKLTAYIIIERAATSRDLLSAIENGTCFSTRSEAEYEIACGFDSNSFEVREIIIEMNNQ